MTILLLVLGFVIFSTILVVAAGMLSSRLSKQERRLESFDLEETTDTELTPQSVD